MFKGALLVVVTLIASALLVLAATRGAELFRHGTHNAAADFQEQLARDIRGADVNENGIRDDVEQWIDGRFTERPHDRQAFLQVAADYQSVLLTTGKPEASRRSLLRLSESLRCVRHLSGSGVDEEIARFKAVVLDTDLRVRAWLKASERMERSGIAAESNSSASSCRFVM